MVAILHINDGLVQKSGCVLAGAHQWALKNAQVFDCYAKHGVLPDKHISTLTQSCFKALISESLSNSLLVLARCHPS